MQTSRLQKQRSCFLSRPSASLDTRRVESYGFHVNSEGGAPDPLFEDNAARRSKAFLNIPIAFKLIGVPDLIKRQ